MSHRSERQLTASSEKAASPWVAPTSRSLATLSLHDGIHPVPQLQRTLGNQAVLRLLQTRMFQAKLAVSQPDDIYEQEADRVAEQVMRMPEPAVQRTCASCAAGGQFCQKCEEGEKPAIQRKVEVQGPAEEQAVSEDVVHGLGLGQPLDPATRAFFEPRFGADFGHVRVHTDGHAAESARAVNARAFTLGRDVVFGGGQYAPQTAHGQQLLAHELAHVMQQNAGVPMIRREVCPTRPAGEAAQSRTSGGIVAEDVIFTPSVRKLVIQDFAVDRSDLPSGATTNPNFERFMSLAVGDPTTALSVKGYTDCVGSAPENLTLRDQRAQAAINAFPASLRTHPRFSFPTSPTTDFRMTNLTPEGRAGNRAVEITFASVPASPGQDVCDVPARAASMDEYMFLVRCAENRLGLRAASDAPTMVSVMRQLYFGSASWSVSSNSVWNSVITGRPWSPSTNPETRMGTHLFTALRNSQVVGGHDMGHLLTGLDAMLNPGEVFLSMGRISLATGLANEEWATWAGDAGSAAAEFAVDTYANTVTGTMPDYFSRFAGVDDLLGNLDSYAIRAGLTGLPPATQLQQPVRLSGTFSDLLMQYFRISSSAPGRSRVNAKTNFIQAYGGVLSGGTLTNRPAFEATLRPPIENFAGRFVLFKMLQRGFLNTPPPSPGPLATVTLPGAVDEATRLYTDFLLAS